VQPQKGLQPTGTQTMRNSIQQVLINVWRQTLVEKAATVTLGGRKFRIKRNFRSGLKQVDFVCEGEDVRGLEQNRTGNSRYAQMAREGKLIMQFLFSGQHVANVTDGTVHIYSGAIRIQEQPRNTQAGA
jgi:hypothetical protein